MRSGASANRSCCTCRPDLQVGRVERARPAVFDVQPHRYGYPRVLAIPGAFVSWAVAGIMW